MIFPDFLRKSLKKSQSFYIRYHYIHTKAHHQLATNINRVKKTGEVFGAGAKKFWFFPQPDSAV
jgi:hypothetical protein